MSVKMFYDNMISYLRKNNGCWENVYLISSLLQSDDNFHYRYNLDEDDNIDGFIGMWEDEKAVTMTGNAKYCMDFYELNKDKYVFYDINENVSSKIMARYKDNISKLKSTKYHVMNMDTSKFFCDACNLDYELVSRDSWEEIRDEYLEKHNIKFTQYHDDKMEWYVSKDKNGDVVSNLCFEKVMDDIYILSNFYSSPEVKGHGIGRRLFKALMNQHDRKLVLFVKKDNPIVDFYEEIGFNRVASTWSFGI